MIKIVNRWNGQTIWEGNAESVREAVIKAIKEGANLRGADLSYADLSTIKEDVLTILSLAKPEIPALYKALIDGKINGSVYEGECACLCGTIANARGVDYMQLTEIKPDSSRPAERFFLAINKGDNPENNQVSAIVRDWIEEFAKENDITLPTRCVIWSDETTPEGNSPYRERE